MLRGRCFCGFIRYVADGVPAFQTNCHCATCRRTSGAPFVTWFSLPSSAYRIESGEPARFASSEHGERTFCPRCGTPLTFTSNHFPGQIDITTCSLEEPDVVPPKDHTYVQSQLPWVKLADGLPRYRRARE